MWDSQVRPKKKHNERPGDVLKLFYEVADWEKTKGDI